MSGNNLSFAARLCFDRNGDPGNLLCFCRMEQECLCAKDGCEVDDGRIDITLAARKESSKVDLDEVRETTQKTRRAVEDLAKQMKRDTDHVKRGLKELERATKGSKFKI